jgi:hypothetical protein
VEDRRRYRRVTKYVSFPLLFSSIFLVVLSLLTSLLPVFFFPFPFSELLLALERSKKAKLTGDNLVFRGWRVAFLLKEEKQILYRSIMEFGGAIVIPTVASSSNLLSELLEAEVTHVFVERLNIQKDHRRMSELSKAGMKVLISTFITEALILDPRPPLQMFYWDKHFKKGAGTATSTTSIRGTGSSTKGSTSIAVQVTNGSGARKKW